VSPYRRSPRPLSQALARAEAQWAPQTLLAEVQRCWSDTVGEMIAAEATPTSERAGVLTIACTASVWAQELDLMAPVILERLNTAVGGGVISRLRCVTLPAGDGARAR
jgi:predicted nucleic acid-binding Zn ribbon protein